MKMFYMTVISSRWNVKIKTVFVEKKTLLCRVRNVSNWIKYTKSKYVKYDLKLKHWNRFVSNINVFGSLGKYFDSYNIYFLIIL